LPVIGAGYNLFVGAVVSLVEVRESVIKAKVLHNQALASAARQREQLIAENQRRRAALSRRHRRRA
jgi:hypothetical protein